MSNSFNARESISQQVTEEKPLHIPVTVVLEVEWVLRSRHEFYKATVVGTYLHPLRTKELTFESETAVEIARHHYQAFKAYFADRLYVALAGSKGQSAPLHLR